MFEKLKSQTLPLAGAFDNAGNIGHNQRSEIPQTDNAKIWNERGKRIIGNFRFCGGHSGKKGGLPRVGVPDQPDIGHIRTINSPTRFCQDPATVKSPTSMRTPSRVYGCSRAVAAAGGVIPATP